MEDGYIAGPGKELGANVVIVGTVSRECSLSVMELKALDVKTAEILEISRERFRPPALKRGLFFSP